MSTHRSTWKRSESRAASLFGAKRQPLSGSSGRDDLTRSDSTHDRLFIEVKYRERHAVRSLHDATKALAKKEGKVPIVVLIDKARPGQLVVIHADDIESFVVEWSAARVIEGEAGDRLLGLIRTAVARLRGESIGGEAG